MKRRFVMLAGAASLAGCAAPDVSEYAAQRPQLDLQSYFNGTVHAWGMFSNRSGKVIKRFTVVLVGRWQGNEGVLEEDFLYSDGTKQRRVWRIRKLDDGRYSGSADDVIGEALGQARGNALRWAYTLALPVDGRTWNVQMDDWMYLVDDRVMLNKTTMSKFGVKLGEVTISFEKRG